MDGRASSIRRPAVGKIAFGLGGRDCNSLYTGGSRRTSIGTDGIGIIRRRVAISGASGYIDSLYS